MKHLTITIIIAFLVISCTSNMNGNDESASSKPAEESLIFNISTANEYELQCVSFNEISSCYRNYSLTAQELWSQCCAGKIECGLHKYDQPCGIDRDLERYNAHITVIKELCKDESSKAASIKEYYLKYNLVAEQAFVVANPCLLERKYRR
jgi:hypothetical protein